MHDDATPSLEIHPPPDSEGSTERRGVLGAFDEILRSPQALFGGETKDLPFTRLVFGAVFCLALYGAAAGFFQGGGQVLVAALKVPLIVVGSLLLCMPSFYVLLALAGVEMTARWLATALVGLLVLFGLLFAAFLPISWLFSVSSSSLVFMVLFHFGAWLLVLRFGERFLRVACGGRVGAVGIWILLLLLVSMQLTAQLGPVLWRPEGGEMFAPQRAFFTERFTDLYDAPVQP